jgi:glycosyltransferase involved in cell wall biosynthesis
MSEVPIVSVIMPLYNKASYVGSAIGSVLAQTVREWELWIVDNGSDDGSDAIVREYSDPRIHLLEYPFRTGGPGAPRNFGLKHSSGHWVLFLDADDLIESDHLENLLEVAQSNPNSDIVAGHWQEYPENTPERINLMQPTGYGKETKDLVSSAIAFAPWAVHAALIKRSALSPEYYWPEELDQYLGEDIAFWFKLVSKCQVVYGENKGALYRVQTPECRTQNLNPEKWFEGVHNAIQVNIQYLDSHGQTYTSGQCENLMRVYLDIACLAHSHQSTEVKNQCLSLASEWLFKYFYVTRYPKLSMILRYGLGLRKWLEIKSLSSTYINTKKSTNYKNDDHKLFKFNEN